MNSEKCLHNDRLTVITPTKGWRLLDLQEFLAYRELLFVLIMRDIKVRYKQTALGALWAIIQPVCNMIIFTVIFGRLAKMPSDNYPYAIYVFAALLPWTFFANALNASSNSLLNEASLISKVYFPRLIIPVASIGSGLMDLAISSVVMLLLMCYYSVGWTWNLFMIPLLLIIIIITALGIGTLLAALIVAYRDFRYVMPFLVQFWMFLTPVVYPSSLVPPNWQWLLFLNPMSGVIEASRSAFLGMPFNMSAISISFGIAISILLIGVSYFEKVERRFVDIV
ncbi:MAG: phosphate ABC transporter permease [Legionellales bacterium RIFCSPHIGHO2_12_FULL_37_14]|nr:MAG: phosphate ABC transporter permease [Legionellales bacterium RIFCSPHIGHO2_12_FULL_37_14]